MAKNGKSKEEIRSYIEKKFKYDLSKSINDIRKKYTFDSRCLYSVPPAIIAFLDSDNYESAVRNAVSLGGDADTQACIAGGIAQAYYKEIPKHIVDFCNRRLDYNHKIIVREFEKRYR